MGSRRVLDGLRWRVIWMLLGLRSFYGLGVVVSLAVVVSLQDFRRLPSETVSPSIHTFPIFELEVSPRFCLVFKGKTLLLDTVRTCDHSGCEHPCPQSMEGYSAIETALESTSTLLDCSEGRGVMAGQ